MRIFNLHLILEVRPSVLLSLEFERGVIVHRNLAADVFPTVNFEKHHVWVCTCTLVCYWWL